MPKKIPKIQNEEIDELGILGNSTVPINDNKKRKAVVIYETDDEDDDNEITPTIQRVKEPAPKPKRKLTEKQLQALHEGQQKRLEMARMKKELERQKQEEEKKRQEELIIKKALALKKKQIKKEAILHEISDDDTPIEEIKKIAKKTCYSKEANTTTSRTTKTQIYFHLILYNGFYFVFDRRRFKTKGVDRNT